MGTEIDVDVALEQIRDHVETLEWPLLSGNAFGKAAIHYPPMETEQEFRAFMEKGNATRTGLLIMERSALIGSAKALFKSHWEMDWNFQIQCFRYWQTDENSIAGEAFHQDWRRAYQYLTRSLNRKDRSRLAGTHQGIRMGYWQISEIAIRTIGYVDCFSVALTGLLKNQPTPATT